MWSSPPTLPPHSELSWFPSDVNPLFFQRETNIWQSVSATIWSWVPAGIRRTPSLRTSTSGSKAQPTKLKGCAEATHSWHELLHTTAPTTPTRESYTKAPSMLTLRKPSRGFLHFSSCCVDRLPSSGVWERVDRWKHASSTHSTTILGSIEDFPCHQSFLEFQRDHIPHKITSWYPYLQQEVSNKFLVQVLGFSLETLIHVRDLSLSQKQIEYVHYVNIW
jgi:hypothetical protein